MKNFRPFAALSLAAAFLLPAYGQNAVKVNDFDVYVDLPTGFAFIKTPLNWLFVRKLDAAQLAQLPTSTLTSLLEPEESTLAGEPAKQPASSAQADLVMAANAAGL